MSTINILIAAIHYPVASGRYMADAFRRIGCDVRTIGPTQGPHIWGVDVDPRYEWEPNYTAGDLYGDYGLKGTLEKFDGWKADLIVCMDSAFTLQGERGDYPAPKVLYGVDNHLKTYNRKGERYDHKFLAHHDGPALPVCDCGDQTWLPCAYDPVWFTPSQIPIEQRAYDVLLVGWPTPERQEIVEAMKDAGIAVFATLGAIYRDYRAMYHNAKISLCRSAEKDVAQRVFETAAMGCALLANRVPDLSRLGAREHEHYAPFTKTAEAISEAKRLLSDPAELERLALAGQAWAAPHTWDARAKTILETMRIL